MYSLPRSLPLLEETFVAAGGLGEECTLRQKLHLSLTAKAAIPLYRFQDLTKPIFVPTLSAADNEAETNITKKRISETFQQLYHSNNLAATSTVAIV